MANLQDIGLSAAINILSAIGFLLAFSMLRLQPLNDRVYFPKWYLKGIRSSPTHNRAFASKFVNLDFRTYIKFWTWMHAALRMPEPELIDHAGLDSAMYVRIYLLGLKIFIPITALAFGVLIPINWTGKTLGNIKDINHITFDKVDKLSISNVPSGSNRFWAHILMAYVFTGWTYYVLYNEYKIIANKRLHFLASEGRRPDHFTVLVRNVPPDPDESVSEHVEHFFCVNHRDQYLTHQIVYNANLLASIVEKKKKLLNWLTYYQNKFERNPSTRPTIKTGVWGLCGTPVDAIDRYESELKCLSEEEDVEREKVLSDPNAVIPAAFVSFRTRWGAAICAQTQQTSNPTIWLTEWAPEPRDIYWSNLAIPYVSLSIRRLLMAVALFFLIFFFMIPITFVQSLANIDGIVKVFPFIRPLMEMSIIKSFIQGFLPGIALKIFLIILPSILMTMSKIEGLTSLSNLERRSAGKYYFFILVNVFLGSVITGSALDQLQAFLNQSPSKIPKTLGVAIPRRANFFITYTMVDGWSGVAAEIVRLSPLVMFHIQNAFFVKTDRDREKAMDAGSLDFASSEPRIQLYFLLGLVYAAVTPILLPFIIVFFAFSYIVYRHQIINVYDQKYESGARFWPDVHRHIIICMLISQVLLFGLLSAKEASHSTPFLIALPVLTIWFHRFCKGRFESAFTKFPIQDAMVKDTLELATEPRLNLKAYLQDAYVHPVFKGEEIAKEEEEEAYMDELVENSPLVPTKRSSVKDSSQHGGSSQGTTPDRSHDMHQA
ncbi:CSC1-like protein At4g02900 [Impatiens glandulifera]|uniref:CSC1-like protein At4g02900 n=1 Tax=Impatiens glandulifera TaxID=253017 RepID=UPI001FB09DDE|nr:CSC1-like protein At4g02900 [Impatiens glandulifera]